MLKQKLISILLLVFLVIMTQWGAYSETKKPEAKLKIQPQMDIMEKKFSDNSPIIIEFNNPYGLVTFNHEVHTSYSCSDCHPPFVFKFDDNTDFSLRAHKHCLGCHEGNSMDTDCISCHTLKKAKTIAYKQSYGKSKSEERQKVLNFFYKRRSIRKFQKKAVSKDIIDDLLKAGMAGPTAHNWQPWIFIVVDDPKIKSALSNTSPFASYIKTAPYVIVIAGKVDNYWAKFDCAIAAENILLAAANMGLGSVYCGLDSERWQGAKKILDVPKEYEGICYLPIGYPAEEKKPYTKYNPSKIYWNKFEKGRTESVLKEGQSLY